MTWMLPANLATSAIAFARRLLAAVPARCTRLVSQAAPTGIAIVAATLLVSCGGGGADAAVRTPAGLALSSDRGTAMQAPWAAYPRVIRLAHQSDPARNGRIVASLVENAGGTWQAGFHASDDDGSRFSRLGALAAPEFAGGLCCGTLFEMPRAVGSLAAGTLLYSASTGADTPGSPMAQPIYASADGGATFRRLERASCGVARLPRVVGELGTGVWEPEFLVAADGSLACIFSDETVPGKSQVLALTRTTDGTTWSTPEVIVAGAAASDRPGMAGVRRLPDGRYAMSFEACSTARLDCAAHLKLSDDGVHWGTPSDFGSRPQTAAGQYFRHAPTLAWIAGAGRPAGALALIGQIVATGSEGVDTSDNGRVMLVGTADGASAAWRLVATPIGLPDPPAVTNWCQNYSTPMLSSADGSQVLMIQTDRTQDGGCSARFGKGTPAW